jgi:hypothetical protein
VVLREDTSFRRGVLEVLAVGGHICESGGVSFDLSSDESIGESLESLSGTI